MPKPAFNPIPLSVAIICKDNADTIGRTFDSVKELASEIIVVDSGSTDSTLELAEQAGAKVHREGWAGYIKQKNRALGHCTQPWTLCLDSDESISHECASAIRDAIERDEQGTGGFEINRKVYWAGTPLHHAWQPEWRLRLVRTKHAQWGGYDPHDELRLTDNAHTNRLAGEMRHDAIDTIGEFLARQVAHGRTAAAALHATGKTTTVSKLVTSPVAAWAKMLIARRAYKDGWRGWAAASSVALATIAKHATLLELTRTSERDGE